jgi:hopanoid-associated phosphorylase
MAFEARIAAAPGLQVIRTGYRHELADTISRSIKPDCRGLISFGVAGGLAPGLKTGDCVVGSAVMSDHGWVQTDPHWSQRVLQRLPNAVHGSILGVRDPLLDPQTKRETHARTGAMTVDMESHIVANVAAAHRMPLIAIRVVTDPAERVVPPTAIAAMQPNGTLDAMAVVRSLMKMPREITGLMRTILDVRTARAMLRQHRELLGPAFALPAGSKFAGHRQPTAAAAAIASYLPGAGMLGPQQVMQKAE